MSDRGTALVEFALLLLPLCMVVFGTVDLGRAYQLRTRLHNAAKEGAQIAQFYPTHLVSSCGTPNITSATTAEDAGLGLSPGEVAIYQSTQGTAFGSTPLSTATCPSTGSFTAGTSTVLVKVSRKMTIFTPLVSVLTGTQVTVTGTAEVLVQQVNP